MAIVKGLDELNALVQKQLGTLPAEVVDATQGILDANSAAGLTAAVTVYRAALEAAFGPSPRAVEEFFAKTVADPVSFLPLLEDAAKAAISIARARMEDFRVEVKIGPAEVGISAPAVFAMVGPDARTVLGHLPVDGLTAGLNAGPLNVKGAGFLRSEKAGAYLAADLGPARATLALLLRRVNGEISFLGLLRAEFRPTGIQLGFGFSLDAVGGLVGVGTGADIDALRRGLVDGSALDALFGGTISSTGGMESALQRLDTMFPATPGSVVIGPTLRLGWLTVGTWTLARADIGVILVLPAGRIVVPGRMVIEVPGPGAPLVHIRLDLLGELDVAGHRFAADAALVDSTVLGVLRIGGTAALRLSWGQPAVAVVTVGGFYPGFDPRPAVVPPQRRISLGIDSPLPGGLSLHAEGYVAAATGTLQLGGSLSVSCTVLGTGISGDASLDALVQLSPLWFTATVSGRVTLSAFGIDAASVQLKGNLTGPGPLVLTLEATTTILWEDVGGRTSFVLSSSPGATRAPAPGLIKAVERQLSMPTNVRAEGGSDPDVVLVQNPSPSDVALIAPGAAVVWSQEAFPLGQPVEKADGRLLGKMAAVTVAVKGAATTTVYRPLATAAFTDLTDSEILVAPPFENRPAGLRIAPIPREGTPLHRVPNDHLTIWLPVNERPAIAYASPIHAAGIIGALRASSLAPALSAAVAGVIAVEDETWAVVLDGTVQQEITGIAGAQAFARASERATAMPLAAAQVAVG